MSTTFTRTSAPETIHNTRRDSLELGSLASSSGNEAEDAGSSSPSGPPSSRKLSFDEDPLQTPKTSNGTRRVPGRSYSISSAFDFAPPLFPLSSSGHGYTAIGDPSTTSLDPSLGESGSLEKNKSLTYLNGLSLVVGLIIGSGIFSSPSEVNTKAGSPGASLIVWFIAGVLAWTGAASYSELGGAIPLNGGAQVYLSKIFGELMGFLYSWSCVLVLKPGSAAIIAIIFGEYIVRAVIGPDAVDASPWVNKGVAIAGLAFITALNCVSTRLAARAANVFMFFKFIALLGVTVIGIVVPITGFTWRGDPSTDWKTVGWFDGTSTDLSRWAVALYAGLWAFDGWDNVNYVAGEFKNPSRDIPRVIHTSLPTVILSYLLANTAYFLVLPLIVTSSSTTIAVAFGNKVLGPLGSLIFALIVSGSCFGALNATIFTSSRLFYAAAKEGYLPSIIGTLGIRGRGTLRLSNQPGSSKRQGVVKTVISKICGDESSQQLFLTPMASLLLNFVFTSIYVVLGTFSTLLTFYGVAGYFFYFLTVLGLLVLRVKEPHLERPYKCWVTTPVIFCCVSLFLLSRSIVAEPLTSLAVVAFIVAGIAVYFVKGAKRSSGRRRRQSQSPGWQFWKRWGRS
ncbi:MAG: hypothetical protein M1828_006068 [Chrysothrix sp. TS-e1954]|nr:MAG: hypothetical protein M1828_006068 [Chrysothrix sp. TS-e1954]